MVGIDYIDKLRIIIKSQSERFTKLEWISHCTIFNVEFNNYFHVWHNSNVPLNFSLYNAYQDITFCGLDAAQNYILKNDLNDAEQLPESI